MEHTKTTTKQKESQSIQSSVDTKDKENYPLLTREPIPNTPFWIVGSEEIGYKLTWGKYTFNDQPIKTKKEALTWLDEHQWTMILHLIAIAITMEKIPQEQRTEKQPQ